MIGRTKEESPNPSTKIFLNLELTDPDELASPAKIEIANITAITMSSNATADINVDL